MCNKNKSIKELKHQKGCRTDDQYRNVEDKTYMIETTKRDTKVRRIYTVIRKVVQAIAGDTKERLCKFSKYAVITASRDKLQLIKATSRERSALSYYNRSNFSVRVVSVE